ncbi:MAG: hypothetical protein LUI06_01420 [Ruminococcus sp.]|nr:hypothetical protein [Ruminococcus sp.]
MNKQSKELYKRTAIYIAPAAYGEWVDLKKALIECRSFIKRHRELKLMRIYRDERVEIVRNGKEDKQEGKRCPLGAKSNDAWKRLLLDTETSAIEAVVIYAARTIAPTVTELSIMIKGYFIPCGILLADVEANFDTLNGDVESYLKVKTSEYRCTVKHKPHRPYQKRKKGE